MEQLVNLSDDWSWRRLVEVISWRTSVRYCGARLLTALWIGGLIHKKSYDKLEEKLRIKCDLGKS